MSEPEPAPKISFSLGGSKKKQQPAPSNGVKRARALIGEDEDDSRDVKRTQAVTQFNASAGGAIGDHVEPEKGPLVIEPQKNRDWKEASKRKRQRSALPGHGQEDEGRSLAEMEAAVKRVEDARPGYGLNVAKRGDSETDAVTEGDTAMEEAETSQEAPPEPTAEASVQAKTEDEQAMEALLGKKSARTDLSIPAVSEEQAFQHDYEDAPDMASLADYERVPVEDFGAALLRGMGWKDGEGIGSNRGKKAVVTKRPEKRPALLGIGAKEEAAVAQELGTWGKAAKDRKGPAVVYNPVLMRDKETGEMFTEEELKAKQEKEEKAKYEYEFEEQKRDKERARRRREEESDRKDKRSHRRDSERRRRDSDSEDEYRRRKEKERKRRDRERDDEDEDEYRRRKDKERRRRERDREDRDHDRERSRKHELDGRRDRSRERKRERRR
ncbi:hypothetical protein MBLNU230_g6021t1 [Neophaeotheca triangularis]